MRILSYFAKPSFEVLKIRTSKKPKGQLQGSQAKKAVKKVAAKKSVAKKAPAKKAAAKKTPVAKS